MWLPKVLSMTASEKVDIVFAILAGGVYRRWWWANFKASDKQAALRVEWLSVVVKFSAWEIRDGLARWSVQYGAEVPPSAEAFADYLRPVQSDSSHDFFSSVRRGLGG